MTGDGGKLVVLKDGRISHVNIQDVAGKQRQSDARSSAREDRPRGGYEFGD